MDGQAEQDLLGFDESSIKSSTVLSLLYKSFAERFEKAVNTAYVARHCEMDFSVMKYCEDGTSSSNTSFRVMVTDNDSGYISQAMESNSSVETANDNRQVATALSISDVTNVYLNEDTLLEKPQISPKETVQEDLVEQYREYDHLFYMWSSPECVLESSVASKNTTFSGFEGDESEISDTSGTITVATPLIVSSNLLDEPNSSKNVNNSLVEQSYARISDTFLPSTVSSSEEFLVDLKANGVNSLNVKSNLQLISPVDEGESMEHKSLGRNVLNCIQTGIMDTTAYETSLFESFYSHLCGLYTRNDFPAEDISKVAINPHSLQISNQCDKDQLQENFPSSSPYRNSYLQLECVNKQSNVESTLTSLASATANATPLITVYPVGNVVSSMIHSVSPTTNLVFPTTNSVSATNSVSSTTNSLFPATNLVSAATKSAAPATRSCISKIEELPSSTENHSELRTNKPQVESNQDQLIKVPIIQNNRTPTKQYKQPVNLELSPELFSDEEVPEVVETFSRSFSQIQKACEKIYITKNDRKLLKYTQESLGGVLPPPSVTIIQMSVDEMLKKIKDNDHLFISCSTENLSTVNNDNSLNEKGCLHTDNLGNGNIQQLNRTESSGTRKSLLVTCRKEDFASESWPVVMQYRYHGLHHNRSKVSEDFEHLCLKYAERCIGAETQSSCTVFGMDIPSPSKRRYKLKRVAKSPGKRLSHLARRRITFSKDSLQSSSSSCSFIGARTRQIMVDARKFELLSRRKSPRKKSPRKTPGKSPRKKSETPGSSSKKRFATRLRMYSNEESLDSVASNSSRASIPKRALFQSPTDKGETTNGLLQLFTSNTSGSESSQHAKRRTPRRALFTSPLKTSPTKMSISSLYPPKRKATPTRALFKSPEKSPSKSMESCDRKRKRVEAEDERPSKFSRSTVSCTKDSLNDSKSRTTARSQSLSGSGGLQGQDIVEHRKKKLIWAVAEALRSQNIDMKHPQFKVFASVLARVIRHFLPNLFNNGPRPEGSSTESMLRIARQHVFAVTRGKSFSQIVRESENSKVRPSKPSGYVGLDKVEKPVDSRGRNKENILQDRLNIIGSDRSTSEGGHTSKINRGEKVERIRRVINFGEDDEVGHSSFR